jgi:hypothetical protein
MSKHYEIRIVATTESGEVQDIWAKALIKLTSDLDPKKNVNKLELLSIRALVAYRAYCTKLPDSLVECAFCDAFNVGRVTDLTSDRYDNAIVWLVDWEPPLVN